MKVKILDKKKLKRNQIGKYLLSGLFLVGYEVLLGLYYRQQGITEMNNYIEKNHPDEWAKITQKIKEED